MLNALTIDVEDWRSVVLRILSGKTVPPSPLVVEETKHILEILAAYQVRATFFVLANVAETFPELVREIDNAGHEVGSHGLSHQRIYTQSPALFREETHQAKAMVEDAIGKAVIGYRAAEFSITKESWWALDILAEEGFIYDSSIYPIKGSRYGVVESPLAPHQIQTSQNHTILEFPLTAVEWLGRRWPVAGGGYFALLPYWLTHRAVRAVAEQGRPSAVYLHPYEFAQTKLQVSPLKSSAKARLSSAIFHAKHNYSRKQVPNKFTQMIQDFQFAPVREVIDDVRIG